jgi:hypothetical protein
MVLGKENNSRKLLLMKSEIISPENLEKQYNDWLEIANLDSVVSVTDDELRETIVKDLTYFSSMGVAEYTLYQKWEEVQTKYPTKSISTIFCQDEMVMTDQDKWKRSESVLNNIWMAESPDDYLKLKPRLQYTNGEDFTDLRVFTHTMKHVSNIGRNLHYLVVDDVSSKYLGVVSITSDFLNLRPRDDHIGWEEDAKTYGMINHTAICSCIAPVQPFGFNYVGGKLLALLCLSDTIRHDWEKRYGDKLAGVTTTSLYGNTKAGGLSQYDNLKYWKKMGFTQGKMSFVPSKSTHGLMLSWLKKHYHRKYFEWYVAKRESGLPFKREHQNRAFAFIYSKLKIPATIRETSHQRGIYFAPLYENTNEFLRGETKDLTTYFDSNIESLTELWKNKYARQRINSLVKNDRISDGQLYYRDLAFMTWNEARDKYLGDVGR